MSERDFFILMIFVMAITVQAVGAGNQPKEVNGNVIDQLSTDAPSTLVVPHQHVVVPSQLTGSFIADPLFLLLTAHPAQDWRLHSPVRFPGAR